MNSNVDFFYSLFSSIYFTELWGNNTNKFSTFNCEEIIQISLLLLLLLLENVGSARLRESDIHPITPRTTAPQYQLTNRQKEEKGKISRILLYRGRPAFTNKKALTLLLKPGQFQDRSRGTLRGE